MTIMRVKEKGNGSEKEKWILKDWRPVRSERMLYELLIGRIFYKSSPCNLYRPKIELFMYQFGIIFHM